MFSKLLVVAAFALSSFNANAGLLNVKTIEISNEVGIDVWLQVAEFQAFNMSGTNVALASNGATASAPDSWDWTSTADKAIDGNTDGVYWTGSLFHEGKDGNHDTLVITLSSISELNGFQIFGRTDGWSYRDIYQVVFKDDMGNALYMANNVDASGNTHNAGLTFVPEPTTTAMFGLGLLALFALRRHQA